MEKVRKTNAYKNAVLENQDFFSNYYFHSVIDLSLIKVHSIIENGILSKEQIEKKSIISPYTHYASSFDSKNGNTFVSLSYYLMDGDFNELFSSFAFHTLSSVAFMVDKTVPISKMGERETYFDDEIFVKDRIEKDKIKGIILPQHLTDMNLYDISFLANDLSCYTKSYIHNYLMSLGRYFRKNIDVHILDESIKQFWEISQDYSCPERWIGMILHKQKEKYGFDLKDQLAFLISYLWEEKLGTSSLTYMEVLDTFNPSLPVYEIGKTLKKIR